MANPLLATDLDLANYTGKSWSKNIRGGVLAKLAPQDPQLKVGSTDHFTFTGTPKAELVGEGDDKSSNDGTPTKKTAKTYTVQITYRFSNQLMWQDEDYQAGVVDGLVANIATALSRALDLLASHDFNAFQWGVARNVPLETIEYGDPDGAGDLKRTNEIAIRAEAVIGFVIFDGAAFSLIQGNAAS
jgi:hypothetical protein